MTSQLAGTDCFATSFKQKTDMKFFPVTINKKVPDDPNNIKAGQLKFFPISNVKIIKKTTTQNMANKSRQKQIKKSPSELSEEQSQQIISLFSPDR
ncbi:MAG: hypothetical protein R3D71_11100 [Rickettsiales bacterium]